MAISRCNGCAHLQEQPEGRVGETIACPKCGKPVLVHHTMFFIGRLLDKYFEAQREISRLKVKPASEVSAPSPAAPPRGVLDAIDLFNTDYLASDQQHKPIQDWFSRQQIKVQVNTHGVDTTGFFDEVAVAIGRKLTVLKEVLERIRWAQQKEYSSTTIQLGKKSEEEKRAISAFCQQLYDFSFVAKCF